MFQFSRLDGYLFRLSINLSDKMKVLESVMEEMTRFCALHLNVEDAVLRETSLVAMVKSKNSSCYAKLDGTQPIEICTDLLKDQCFSEIVSDGKWVSSDA
jgi:hypothetical protein